MKDPKIFCFQIYPLKHVLRGRWISLDMAKRICSEINESL